MLKILQASLQQFMNQELPDVQAGFRKGRGGGRGKDGGGIGREDHFLPHKFLKRTFQR